MTYRSTDEPFASMSPAERERYGSAEDWQVEGYVGPRGGAAETAQFSLRLPRREFEALRALAADRSTSFSTVVREALDQYLRPGTEPERTTRWLHVTSRSFVVFLTGEVAPVRTVYRPGVTPQVTDQEPTTA